MKLTVIRAKYYFAIVFHYIAFLALFLFSQPIIAVKNVCYFHVACDPGQFCSQTRYICQDCWKCCAFSDVYNETYSSCKKRCDCRAGQFCYTDDECGPGELCGIDNECISANTANDIPTNITNLIRKHVSLAQYLATPLQLHSFSFCFPPKKGCPCGPHPHNPCPRGFKCIPGLYGGTESDIVLTGGIAELNGGALCVECEAGETCIDGFNSTPYAAGTFNGSLCPPGYYCPYKSPAPLSCNFGGIFSITTIPSFADIKSSIIRGNYCPNGSSIPSTPCPPKMYCPDPSTSIICPQGHYCRKQSISPIKCPIQSLTKCYIGTDIPPISGFVWVFISLWIFLGFLIIYRNRWISHFLPIRPKSRQLQPITLLPTTTRIRFLEYKNLSAGTWLAPNSGHFKAGKLNAVMGSSGCGKSTLIELIRGRVQSGSVTGSVRISFESPIHDEIVFDLSQQNTPQTKMQLASLRNLLGFVPQDDLVYADLTVRENLEYSALLKTRTTSLVDEIIAALGITAIQHKLVGSPEKRSISGGQRKRVNIGLELVGGHPIIFLDEPTSGLDSTGSFTVLKYCRDTARQTGQCFVCVIHQPKFSTFMLFDRLSLLGKTGTVFSGTPGEALAYFNSCLGIPINPDDNPADVLMDFITYGCKSIDKTIKPEELPILWNQKGGKQWVDDLKRTYPNITNILLSEFTYQRSSSPEALMTPEEIFDFFSLHGNINVSHRDILNFLGKDRRVIPTIEFERKIEYACNEARIDGYYATMIDKLNALPFNMPQSILFDKNIERWRAFRVNTLVLTFINRLKHKAGIVARPHHSNNAEILKKEMLLAVLCKNQNEIPTAATRELLLTPNISTNSKSLTPSVFYRIAVLLKRRLVSFDRSPWFVQIAITIIAALIVGSIHGASGSLTAFPGNIAMAMACIGVLGTVTHVRTFSIDKAVINREIKNNIEITALYLAYNLIDLIWVIIIPVIYFVIYHLMTYPQTNIGWFIVTGMLVEWWVSGFAYFVSMTPLGVSWANLLGVFVSIIMGAFINGLNPTIADSTTAIKVVLGLSYNRWAMEALTIKEMETRSYVQPNVVYGLIDKIGICGGKNNLEQDPVGAILKLYKGDSITGTCTTYVTQALWILFSQGLFWRILSYITLWLGWNATIKLKMPSIHQIYIQKQDRKLSIV